MATDNLTATGLTYVDKTDNLLLDSLTMRVFSGGGYTNLLAHGDNEISYYFHGADNFTDSRGKTSYSVEWTEAEKASLKASLQAFSAVSNLSFVESDTADVTKTDLDIRLADSHYDTTKDWSYVRAYSSATPYSSDSKDYQNDVVYRSDYYWDETHPLYEDCYRIQQKDNFTTQLHEFGHSMGLIHPHATKGDFDGVINPYDRGEHGLNDQRYTVMSYNSTPKEGNNWLNYMGSSTLMVLDIAVIQHLYGANMSVGSGNNVYNLEDVIRNSYKAIWDAGGNDKIQYSGTEDVVIDLRAGHLNQNAAAIIGEGVVAHNYNGAAGYYNGLYDGNQYDEKGAELFGGYYIANNVVIENASGGSGDDRIIGNDANNILMGGDGDDTIYGHGGDDIIYGQAGNDRIYGGAGADILYGGGGRDVLYGQNGDDIIYGGNASDRLFGQNGDDKLYGEEGNDVFIGGAGADYMDGGSGFDTVSYVTASSAVIVDLLNSDIGTGDAKGDSFNSIEKIIGSDYNDIIFGSDSDSDDIIRISIQFNDSVSTNASFVEYGRYIEIKKAEISKYFELHGGEGNDQLHARSENTILFGGKGADHLVGHENNSSLNPFKMGSIISYKYAESGVTVNLEDASQNAGEAKGDTYGGRIGGVEGSQYDDVIYRGNGKNTGYASFYGLGGNDVIHGANGMAEWLYGGDGDDVIYAYGGLHDVLYGGAGADYLYGGATVSEASYEDATSAILLDVTDMSRNTGDAKGDTFVDINRISGTNFDDIIHASDEIEWVFGGKGNDHIYGSAATDDLVGEEGNDKLYGHAGNDMLSGDDGDDYLYGGEGNDKLYGGCGNDYLSGGAGADNYYYQKGDGNDIISDAGTDNALDRIIFNFGHEYMTSANYDSDNNLCLNFASQETITIYSPSEYTIEEFVFDDISFTAEQFLAANGLSI